QERIDRNRREEERVLLREREAAGEHDLEDEQEERRHPGGGQQEHTQRRGFSGDVFDSRQRFREIDLKRVGAAIVGDQPCAYVDRDEKDEDALLFEILAERLRRRREERRLRKAGRDV